MSNYGSSLYGINYYGVTPNTSGSGTSYYNSGLTTTHIDYRTIIISWGTITPQPSDYISAWKVVKTVGGAPDYPNRAPVVVSGTAPSGSLSFSVTANTYTDKDTKFPAGTVVTYSMWVLVGPSSLSTPANWLNVGSADAIIVEDDNETTYKLLSLLPSIWTSASGDTLGEPDIPRVSLASASDIKGAWTLGANYSINQIVTYNNLNYYCINPITNSLKTPDVDYEHFEIDTETDIHKFLKNFGFYYDKLRAETKVISNISDYRYYPHRLLPLAINSLGFDYEPSLGDNYHRSLYKSGNIINSLKGSRLGLQTYIKSLTNFDSVIKLGRNILPSIYESTFEGDHGNWYCTGGYIQYKSRTVTGETNAASATALSTTSLTSGYGLITKGVKLASVGVSDPVTGTLTFTTTDTHGITSGTSVTITGVKPTIFNITGTATVPAGSLMTFTVPSTITNKFKITGFTHVGNNGYTTVSTGGYTHGLTTGDVVTITGSTNFNGTWTVASSVSAYTFNISINPPGGWNTAQTGTGVSTINVASSSVTATGITSATVRSYGANQTNQDRIGKLIPISPNKPYLFSGWAKSISTNTNSSCTISAQIDWFNSKGELISSATAGTTATLLKSPGDWVKFESNNTYTQVYSPINAAFAGVTITTGTLNEGEAIAVDYFSFGAYPGLAGTIDYGIGDVIYDDARDVKINLRGYRTNYIPNPNFEEGLSGWRVNSGGAGTFTQDFSQTPPFSGGTAVAKLNGIGKYLYSNWIKNLTPSTYYTFSIYVKTSANLPVRAAIEFSTPQDISTQSNSFVDGAGSYFKAVPYKTYSDSITTTSGSWTRISVTAKSPDYVAKNGLPAAVVSVEFNTAPSGDWWVDAAMLEESLTAGTYFQGNGGKLPDDLINGDYIHPDDCAWETRLRTNFISNPGFENASTQAWFVTTGTAAISTSSSVKKFGTYSGSVNYQTANSGISTNVHFPIKLSSGSSYVFPIYGDTVSISAYVYAPVAGQFFISTTNTATSVSGLSPSYVYTTTNNWVRIDKTIMLSSSDPYITVEIRFLADSGTTGVWYVDGVQLEIGEIVSAYVDTSAGVPYSSITSTGPTTAVTAVSKPTAVSLYTNDFEVTPTTTLYGTSYYTISNGTATVARDSAARTSGTYSLSISNNTTASITCRLQGNTSSTTYLPTQVIGGATYTAGVKVKRAATTGATGFAVVINWLDASYSPISTTVGTGVTLTTTFQSVSVTDAAPSTAAYAFVSVQYNTTFATLGAVYMDEAYLSLSGLTQYAVGSSTGIIAGDVVAIQGISINGYNTTGSQVYSVDSSSLVTVYNTGSGTPTFSNATMNTVGTIYATNTTMSGIGRSYYWPNKAIKFSRLVKTLANYLPLGSTYTLNYGQPTTTVNENIRSTVSTPSFENGLYKWNAVGGATLGALSTTPPSLARYIGDGSTRRISNYVMGAFSTCYLDLSNSSNTAYFGIQQDKVPVLPGTKYKLSTAISHAGSDSLFSPNYYITWYDSAGSLISSVSLSDSTSMSGVGTTTASTKTITFANGALPATPRIGDRIFGSRTGDTNYVYVSSVSTSTAGVITVTTSEFSDVTGTPTITFQSHNYISDSSTTPSPYFRDLGYWGNFYASTSSPNNAAYASIAIVVKPYIKSTSNEIFMSRVIVLPSF